jgi:hypothetical protein
LHIIINKFKLDVKTNDHQTEVVKQVEVYRENQKAVEKDFVKQEESFRKRLALRKNGKIFQGAEWGNESTIKNESIFRGNLSPEQSMELNSSDMNLGKLVIYRFRKALQLKFKGRND